jgi:hypothetical protein
MRVPAGKTLILAVAAALAGVGLFLLGHLSADSGDGRAKGYQAGHSDGYFDGLNAGVAQGRQEGRALQAASTVPSDSRQPVQDAFNDGYAAGENDAFGNYDGGWEVGPPYLITVARASTGAVYRIAHRTLLVPGVDYYLCADGSTICSTLRH